MDQPFARRRSARGRLALGAAAAAVVLGVVACTTDDDSAADASGLEATLPAATTPPPPPETWPGDEWAVADQGEWDDLDAAAQASASTCVVVVRDGRVVHRWEAPGTDRRTTAPVWSVTKSMTALLVAAAVGDGDLALDDAASAYLPQWRGGDSADVTVRQLLSNTSGRRWTYDLDYGQMVRRAADKTAFALGLGQQHDPGTHWEYNNSAVQALGAVLEAATGVDVEEYARSRLAEPIGLRDTTWGRDAAGAVTTFSGVTSTCDDLARIGLLVARGGRWEDDAVVPDDVLQELTGEPSSGLNAAYAGLWWVNDEGRVQTIEQAAGFGADRAPYEGRFVEDAPADARWALGYGNQVVAVVPSEDLVAVRLGARPGSADVMGPEELTRLARAGLRTDDAG